MLNRPYNPADYPADYSDLPFEVGFLPPNEQANLALAYRKYGSVPLTDKDILQKKYLPENRRKASERAQRSRTKLEESLWNPEKDPRRDAQRVCIYLAHRCEKHGICTYRAALKIIKAAIDADDPGPTLELMAKIAPFYAASPPKNNFYKRNPGKFSVYTQTNERTYGRPRIDQAARAAEEAALVEARNAWLRVTFPPPVRPDDWEPTSPERMDFEYMADVLRDKHPMPRRAALSWLRFRLDLFPQNWPGHAEYFDPNFEEDSNFVPPLPDLPDKCWTRQYVRRVILRHYPAEQEFFKAGNYVLTAEVATKLEVPPATLLSLLARRPEYKTKFRNDGAFLWQPDEITKAYLYFRPKECGLVSLADVAGVMRISKRHAARKLKDVKTYPCAGGSYVSAAEVMRVVTGNVVEAVEPLDAAKELVHKLSGTQA